MSDEQWISTRRAAAILGISTQAMTKRAARGQRPEHRRTERGHLEFRESDVWLVKHAKDQIAVFDAGAE